MTGSLLISLDCEGKWGFSDDPRIVDDTAISDSRLRDAYDFLFRSLEKHGLKATFAIVGLFAAGREKTVQFIREVGGEPGYQQWLTVPRLAMSSGRAEGWFLEDLPGRVMATSQHELASHGYSHLPFTFPEANELTVRHELAKMESISRDLNWGIESMVYPRNAVAYSEILGEYGIRRYRTSTEPVTFLERSWSLVGELNVWTASDQEPGSDGMISAGRFLNWRSGPRRIVPSRTTFLRWRNICRHAAKSGGCAHLWFHPHNLITGHRQYELVSEVFAEAGRFVQRRELRSLTFKEV